MSNECNFESSLQRDLLALLQFFVNTLKKLISRKRLETPEGIKYSSYFLTSKNEMIFCYRSLYKFSKTKEASLVAKVTRSKSHSLSSKRVLKQ